MQSPFNVYVRGQFGCTDEDLKIPAVAGVYFGERARVRGMLCLFEGLGCRYSNDLIFPVAFNSDIPANMDELECHFAGQQE